MKQPVSNRIMNVLKHTLIAITILALSGCSFFGGDKKSDSEEIPETESAEQLYNRARAKLDGKDYQGAIENYETLESRYPFGNYAQQAQLESAYAYYKYEEYDSAIATADRFIQLNPKHPRIDYAYYIKGLTNFYRGNGILNVVIPRDPSDKDPQPLQQAFNDFNLLVTNYPDSRYTPDSRQRMVFVRNMLAKHEMHVADFYMRRGAYIAVVNRSKYVMEKYQGADTMPQALMSMSNAYQKLGLNDLAEDSMKVLRLNYPSFATRGEDGILESNCERSFGQKIKSLGRSSADANCLPEKLAVESVATTVVDEDCDIDFKDRLLSAVGGRTLYCEKRQTP